MTAKSIHQVQIHNEETLVQRHRESSEYMPEGIRCEGTKFIYSGNHLHMSSSIIMEFLALRVLQESRRCDTQGYNQKEIKCLECDFPRRDPTSSTSDHQLIKATRSLREAYVDYTGSLRKEDHEDPLLKKRSSTDIKCIICSYLWPPDDCDVLTAADGEVSSRIRCPSLGSFQVGF